LYPKIPTSTCDPFLNVVVMGAIPSFDKVEVVYDAAGTLQLVLQLEADRTQMEPRNRIRIQRLQQSIPEGTRWRSRNWEDRRLGRRELHGRSIRLCQAPDISRPVKWTSRSPLARFQLPSGSTRTLLSIVYG
jgi:hypothetical protein